MRVPTLVDPGVSVGSIAARRGLAPGEQPRGAENREAAEPTAAAVSRRSP